jgi:nicotinamide-nucleotide amidase
MPSAEIIAIGTELLLGEIQDTNTRYLARSLMAAGVDLYRTTIVGDNVERIARAIQEALQRCQIVITTGGLGPTVDDPTRDAVALAAGVQTEFRSELWDQIQERFKRYGRQATENNKRQAFTPQGSIAIHNPVGTAPAFYTELHDRVVVSLPGVPREMEYLFENEVLPYLKDKYNLLGTIKASVLHAAGIGESQIDEWIGDLETNPNPTVGLSAHAGQIDIRVTAKASSVARADEMIIEMVQTIRQRLGEVIYGINGETLESVIFDKLIVNSWELVAIECGLQGELINRLKQAGLIEDKARTFPQACDPQELRQNLQELRQQFQAGVGLAASLKPGADQQELFIIVATTGTIQESNRSYGGPPAMSTAWAVNTALDYLRRNIK